VSTITGEEPRTALASRCMLCGNEARQSYLTDVTDYLTLEKFDIDLCARCGLMVTRPFSPDAQIDRYYPPRYRGDRHGFTKQFRINRRRKAIEACFPRGFRGRLLDVGCGDGAFVLEMRRRGWEVCATEIDPATTARLRAEGIDARLPSEAEAQGFDQPFDAVTCWHVMEHVEQPQNVVAWVKRQIKPTGFFQASVPNAGCLQARLFRGKWIHFDVPRHRYHFTPATFRSLLQNGGFTPIRSSCFALEYDWFGVIQSALNEVCSKRNVLFDKLTHPPETDRNASVSDAIISYALCAPLAAISLPPLLLAWALGDGATLTITCKAK
jgi:SAM-dependent methyltransferase